MLDLWLTNRSQNDADALAFISAASISDPTQISAIHFLVGGLKSLNLWTKMIAVYPFVGGSASAHAVNLKTPGTFNISGPTWSSGVTHNSNGITGNGTTGYGLTGIIPRDVMVSSNASFCLYSRTPGINGYELSSESGGSQGLNMLCRYNSGVNLNRFAAIVFGTTENSPFVTEGSGCFICSKTSLRLKSFRNGVLLSSQVDTNGNTPTSPITILCRNQNSGTYSVFSSRNLSFCSIGTSLADAEAINLSTLVQYFQSILGRAV